MPSQTSEGHQRAQAFHNAINWDESTGKYVVACGREKQLSSFPDPRYSSLVFSSISSVISLS